MTGFGFHAAPPAGHWINDPNGLVFSGARYRLFVQHRADAPDFMVTGWARFSSDDLLAWEWDGEVLAADEDGFAYSGSIAVGTDAAGASLDAWHTRHRPAAVPRERQFVAHSHDSGLHWSAPNGPQGPGGRNARDPYVFGHRGIRHMLVARPCDWVDTADMSRFELASQSSSGNWSTGIDLGLEVPAGLLCEVPSLLRCGEKWLLLASFVDRTTGDAICWTGYWLGSFDGNAFEPDQPHPIRLDIGPDFYAAIANVDAGWPAERMLIGWASSWATARRLNVPGGGSGGGISMPRKLVVHGAALHLAPIPAALRHGQSLAWSDTATLTIRSNEAVLVVELGNGKLEAQRYGAAEWIWACTHIDVRIAGQLMLFHDKGLVELFIGGIAMTVMIPGRQHRIDWKTHDDA